MMGNGGNLVFKFKNRHLNLLLIHVCAANDLSRLGELRKHCIMLRGEDESHKTSLVRSLMWALPSSRSQMKGTAIVLCLCWERPRFIHSQVMVH